MSLSLPSSALSLGDDDKGVHPRGAPRGGRRVCPSQLPCTFPALRWLQVCHLRGVPIVSPSRMQPTSVAPRCGSGAAGTRWMPRGCSTRLPGGARGPGGVPGTLVPWGDMPASPGSPVAEHWSSSCLREQVLRAGVGFAGLRGAPRSTRDGPRARGGRWPARASPRFVSRDSQGTRSLRALQPHPGGELGCVPPPTPSHPLPNRRTTAWGAVSRLQ